MQSDNLFISFNETGEIPWLICDFFSKLNILFYLDLALPVYRRRLFLIQEKQNPSLLALVSGTVQMNQGRFPD